MTGWRTSHGPGETPSTCAMSIGGRPALTSAHELAAVAQYLFLERGFDQTGVDE